MKLTYQNQHYIMDPNQSVLDCLLNHGVHIPHFCKSGVCNSCILKCKTPNIPSYAQNGLKESQKQQGYFLSCVFKPEMDLDISDPGTEIEIQGQIRKIHLIHQEVIGLQIEPTEGFTFRAGQYITLIRKDRLARSYSISSLPSTGCLELHIRVIPNGKMSSWIKHTLREGEQVSIRGPNGNCFYSTPTKLQPILLAGTGTGLAPLYGILKDALQQNHSGPIWLFHGGRNRFSLYLQDELQKIATVHENFKYFPCVLSEGSSEIPEIPLDQNILKNFHFLKDSRVYLCGEPLVVNSLRKKLFIAGASAKEIYADAFLSSAHLSKESERM